MKEIKYRGKGTDGIWRYGSLEPDYKQPGNMLLGQFFDYFKSGYILPETVGDYTGLKDSNGKEIYEGDIVELRQETPKGSEGLLITAVKWSEDGLNFNVYPCHDEKYWKVIGNIYDNPELLTRKD